MKLLTTVDCTNGEFEKAINPRHFRRVGCNKGIYAK